MASNGNETELDVKVNHELDGLTEGADIVL